MLSKGANHFLHINKINSSAENEYVGSLWPGLVNCSWVTYKPLRVYLEKVAAGTCFHKKKPFKLKYILCSRPNSFPSPAFWSILLLLCQLSSLLFPCPPSLILNNCCQLLPSPTLVSTTLVSNYSTQGCCTGCSSPAKCFGECSGIPHGFFSMFPLFLQPTQMHPEEVDYFIMPAEKLKKTGCHISSAIWLS